MERVLRREAHAKINVWLHVLGRRDDGYHEIDTLIVPVSLADELTVRSAPELRLSIRGELADAVPPGEDNLVVVAARALANGAGIGDGADIELDKRIPVAAGLGGGSADAAATLLALNELWACDLDADALLRLAVEIGSDVPALLHGGPVRVRGRGELVETAPQDPAWTGWWVVLPLPFHVPVADAYRWWDEDHARSWTLSEPANDLEEPVGRRHPEIAAAAERLAAAGADSVRMCGSGPTVIGQARSEEHARRIAEAVPGSIPVSAVASPP